MKSTTLSIFCLIAFFQTLYANEFKDSVSVEFRQSHTVIDPGFKNNGAKIDSIIKRFGADAPDGVRYHLRSVNVVGAASPEGSVKFNKYLSEKRASAICDALSGRLFPADSTVRFTYLGRDWNGLRDEVKYDPNVPYRDEVSALLEKITSAEAPAHPLQQLKALRGGVPYIYMYNRLFPQLRMSRVVFSYDRLAPIEIDSVPSPMLFDTPAPIVCPTPEFNMLLGETKQCKPFYLGLKTNLISDLLLIPHIGADLYVGKGWSVTADWMYGWWDKNRTHRYWRAYGGTVGLRKWLGRKAAEKPLIGHHIGLYAGAVTYDFEFGGRGYMGGKPHGTLWERCNFIGGIEYGYSMPVARRLNIDFSIGFGYLGGRYLEYVPKDGFYMWQSTHHLNWFGPTKAEVSLVWLIGCDNYNRKKGGKL
ncbi:MAG: DUF3575 domain-containing protein [Muribaculaceae bacterium]|nr:DUF3575 domain-containing protein [Muribaculaceae bacterium]